LILDTNGLSAMADGDELLERSLSQAQDIEIPVIVLGEYRFGIFHSRYRSKYERWLEETLTYCHILDVNEQTARAYAEIRSELKADGKPIPGNDLWIAALARQYALPVASRDSHFDSVRGLKRVRW
jgi:tRNA(fMet)-specific endonuclease VapC